MGYDLVIVGGGAFGCAAALEAAQRGASTLLLEANIGLAQESSAKSGGILTDLLWHPEDRQFVARSRTLYRAALQESGDVSIARRVGMLTLAQPPTAEALKRRLGDLADRGVQHELIDRDEAVRRFPALDRLDENTSGLWLPEDWHVNPTAYAEAAVVQARAAGLSVRAHCRVERMEQKGGGVVVIAGTERFTAQKVLIAAGAWSRKIVRSAGLDIPLRPYRVQLSSVHLPQDYGLPITWHIDSDVYTVPEGSHDVLAGDGTRLWEFDPDDYQATGDEEFELNIATRLPQLSSLYDRAGLRSSWAGLCGGTPDRRPLVGALAPGVYVACGDNGIGVMRAPAIGELAAQIALDEADAPHLAPTRFPPTDFEIRAGFTLD